MSDLNFSNPFVSKDSNPSVAKAATPSLLEKIKALSVQSTAVSKTALTEKDIIKLVFKYSSGGGGHTAQQIVDLITGLGVLPVAASAVTFAPTGTIAATNVQTAIAESTTEGLAATALVVSNLAASSGSNLVGFLQAGTGATARTVQSKLRESISVSDFGAVGGGVGDQTALVQKALDAVSNGGTLLFDDLFACAGALSLTGKAGITIISKSTNPVAPVAGLRHNGTGAGAFLTFTSCESINLDNMYVDYNAAFTGTLVKIANTARVSIDRTRLYGNGVTSALYLLDMDTSIELDVRRSAFSGAQYLIRGQNQSGAGYANAVHIDTCDFDRYSVASIRNPGQAWALTANAFENRIDGLGAAVAMDAGVTTYGLSVRGNWVGDITTAGAYTWFQIAKGRGVEIVGNYMNGHGALNGTAVKFTEASEGVSVRANFMSSLAVGVDIGSGLVTNPDISANSYATVVAHISGAPVGSTLFDPSKDYIEGTWTPALQFGGATTGITYGHQIGSYRKIGSQVTLWWQILLTSKGSATGDVLITGSPYTNSLTLDAAGTIGLRSNLAAAFSIEARMLNGDPRIGLTKSGAASSTAMTDADFNNNTLISGTMSFIA